MAVNFPQDLERVRIGYALRARDFNEHYELVKLNFRDFIPPFSHKAKTVKDVYVALENNLAVLVQQQDSVTNCQRPVMLDVLARATLEREATKNAMLVIRTRYVGLVEL